MKLSPGHKVEEEEDEEGAREEDDEAETPSHLPFAPSSELFDVSTTVDPSYIISLIRQLLPHKSNLEEESKGNHKGEEKKDPWEECGCILWDLAASKDQAEVMVNNFLLEVLLLNLCASESSRVKEICLGIIGNLACHDTLSNTISSQDGLVETVVQQLFVDDSACLTEAFRLLAVGLQGSSFAAWAECLIPDEILSHVLWTVGNTLNSSLLEKSIDFLLTIIENQQVVSILLQPLIKLGLPNLSVNLLSCEMEKSANESMLERSSTLDLILRLVVALSAVDSFSQLMSSNEQLLQLVCDIVKVKLPDKFEVASYFASAILIIANLLADDKNLLSKFSDDFAFLEGLFDALPLVSEDLEARNALWCVLAGLLAQIKDGDTSSPSSIDRLTKSLLDKSEVIETDLDSHSFDQSEEERANIDYVKLYGVTASLRKIGNIVEKSIAENSVISGEDTVQALQKLLCYCSKYGS